MKRLFPILLMMLAIASCTGKGRKAENAPEPEPEPLPLEGFYTSHYKADTTQVRNGDSFTGLFNRLGLSAQDAYTLANLCGETFDVRRLIAGNRVIAYYTPDTLRTLQYVVYTQNRIRSTVFQCTDSLAIWNVDKPVTHERRYADVTITSSLWNDMKAAGASPALIMNLDDIYQWSINFFSLQEGDRFRFIYDQTVCEGEVIGIDSVFYSVFNGGGKEMAAVRYHKPGEKRAGYWGKDGESLKKMFLKAPLKYSRISSRFSYHRRHPVTGKVKAHTAVDYAAPTGTPIQAIGDGVITKIGWDGSGGGNRIRIKHAQGYESCYMHMSRFAKGLNTGSRVSQGDVIGYVGATGTATGPHLDFRIWLNGKPLDPLSLNSPATEPLEKQYMEEFGALRETYQNLMDSLARDYVPANIQVDTTEEFSIAFPENEN